MIATAAVQAQPFVKWAGGKRQLLSHLLARVPTQYNRYFEPFVGGGALFFALNPNDAYLSDINPELINTYSVIKNNVQHLIDHLKQHRNERDYFYRIREADRADSYQNWDSVQRASRFIFLNKTCYNGLCRVNSSGYFNTPFGNYKNPKILDQENLLACSLILQKAIIKFESFDQAIAQARAGDFVYLDPPYAPLTTTSYFTSYCKNGFDAQMQVKLRDACQRLDQGQVKFMASNSSSPFIFKLYEDFKVEFVDASRAINSDGSKRGKIKEVIITNFSE
jgi:DNA adenine methylase